MPAIDGRSADITTVAVRVLRAASCGHAMADAHARDKGIGAGCFVIGEPKTRWRGDISGTSEPDSVDATYAGVAIAFRALTDRAYKSDGVVAGGQGRVGRS